MLATAEDDNSVRLWDLRTGRHLETLLGHTRRVWSVDFSPTENTLVSSGDDGTALIWDLDAAPPDNGRTASASLVGMASGWIAATPDGRYKGQGDVGSEVWHVIGNSRFPLDSLSDSLPRTVRRVADLDEPLVPRLRPSGHEMLED
jgi:WD domain, G-beta repeat